MTKDVLVFVEYKEGAARKASLELLSKGKDITGHFFSTLYGVVLGYNVKNIAASVKPFADKVIVVENEALAEYRWDTYSGIFENLLRKYNPFLVFGASTVTGKDFFPRVAARFEGAMISDAVGIDFQGNGVKVKKPLFGGKVISWITSGEGSALFVTFRPNSFTVEKRDLGGEMIEEQFTGVKDPKINTIAAEKHVSEKVDLLEADFIICGGRGMKGPEHFQILEEIADVMGGRVGASRAVVDSKWREYEDQVGKSGKTVSPKLYIGCGISGALHHTMGMDTSKIIVAVNKDQNAPIFHYADYGIVDDLFAVLPVLKEELKKTKEEI